MGWFRNTFFYREDYTPALQGLRGVAVLWFFQWSFYSQFDPAKLSHITEGKAWLGQLIQFIVFLLSPSILAQVVIYVLAGFLVVRALEKSSFPRIVLSRMLRFYPVYLAVFLPILVYTNSDFSKLAWAFTFFIIPQDMPVGYGIILSHAFWIPILWVLIHIATKRTSKILIPTCIFLSCAVLDLAIFHDIRTTTAFLSVLAGILAAYGGRNVPPVLIRCGAGPSLSAATLLMPVFLTGSSFNSAVLMLAGAILLAFAVASISAAPSATARFLSHPILRYFGAVALPFFLIHTTWGFRLSRSILQGELHTPRAIAAHYAMSLAFSSVFAGFLHVFFERPYFLRNLRNGPPAATKPASDIQGASS